MCFVNKGIYYYSTDDTINGTGLSFRREVHGHELYDAEFQKEDEQTFFKAKDLGTVPTPHNSIVMFPNDYQHKVQRLHNTHKTKTAYRKVLCFLLLLGLLYINFF